MAGEHSLLDRLHRATHRVPGVPAHLERPAGHHGRQAARRTGHRSAPRGRRRGGAANHSPARPPRVLVAWQRRIAEFLGRESR